MPFTLEMKSVITFTAVPKLLLLGGLLVSPGALVAQTAAPTPPLGALKKLSLEQLMDLEVTSVSKRAEKIFEAASAIQVVTGEQIRRSGATSLPEALRLAANLQVAQVNSSYWTIGARGFNAPGTGATASRRRCRRHRAGSPSPCRRR